ncbi:hypothetical protein M2271_006200, partial [Streptomyces sp. LBL]|nr:hypothetical protein [Streptomyces sp. LBL]
TAAPEGLAALLRSLQAGTIDNAGS